MGIINANLIESKRATLGDTIARRLNVDFRSGAAKSLQCAVNPRPKNIAVVNKFIKAIDLHDGGMGEGAEARAEATASLRPLTTPSLTRGLPPFILPVTTRPGRPFWPTIVRSSAKTECPGKNRFYSPLSFTRPEKLIGRGARFMPACPVMPRRSARISLILKGHT